MSLLLLLSGCLVSPVLNYRVGMVDITPPEPLMLGGYTARHGEVMAPGGDHLFARILILSQGTVRVAIVSSEMLTTPASLVHAVAAKLPDDLHLFMAATHTHSAPDSQMLNDRMTFAIPGIASYKHRWLSWYSDQIVNGVNQVLLTKPHPLSHLFAAQWQADLNRGRRTGALPDKTATLLEGDENGQPLLFEYAAHGTFFDESRNTTSGDWPGGVAQIAPVALMGAIGDVSPKAPGLDKADGATKIAAFWRAMVKPKRTVRRVWPMQFGDLRFRSEGITLAKPVPHPTFAAAYHAPLPFAKLIVQKFAPPQASISAMALGRLAIIGVPGEPTSHLGRLIVAAGKRAGFRVVLVISHVNGWMGYILGPADYDRGGYEATLSFYGREEGLQVVAAASRALTRLAKSGGGGEN